MRLVLNDRANGVHRSEYTDFFVFLLLMGGIAFVIYATFSPVKDQSMRIAFLNDYKEIIDELIENKKSNSIAN